MRRIIALLLAAVLVLSMAACGAKEEPVEEDGGVKNQTVSEAPKTIESTEITKFDCTFSTLAMEETELDNCTYTLQAELQSGTVTGGYSRHDRDGESENYTFTADASFMELLQGVVADHALAAHNGWFSEVSGLPDMYGADLTVVYASGEKITAYDNQDNFLSPAAMKDLVKLFSLAVLEDMGLDMDEDDWGEEPVEPEETLDFSCCYRSPEPDEEGAELWLEVFQYPDFLLLEFHKTIEGSVFTFWAEEYWPDEPCYGQWTSEHLSGKSQEFFGMSTGSRFMGMPRERTITLTEEGLILQYEGSEEEVFLRDDSLHAHTDKEDQVEILWTQLEETDIDFDLVGTWDHWDGSQTIRLTMEADGCFRMLCKDPGLPVLVLRGIWGVGVDSGELLAYAEMTGGGKMPYFLSWQWEIDEYDLLNIHGESPFRPEEGEGDLQLWCAGPEDGLELMQARAMGYLYSHYDMSGTYTDQYGTDYSYWYQIPQFLEDTGDMAEINTEILDLFGPIVEEEMAAMRQEEFVSFDTVAWDAYISEGILTVHVYSHSWEWEHHRTWYYDIQTGTRTDSLDLLERQGITEEEFLSAVREHAEACYVEIFAGTPEEDRETYGYYDMLEWTISDEAVNLDLPIFVDEVGNLCVYARIGSIAGASEFWTPLYPFADWNMYEEAVG